MARLDFEASRYGVSSEMEIKDKKRFRSIRLFIGKNWLGTVIIFVLTLIFFWPVVTRIASYSEGGDAMFNAWTLSRNHHCIMRDGCPSYTDANIYFPNKDTMLYSETQLSTGVLTLPLFWINENPLFAYNIWTIVSFFLSGWFMYLLAKRVSKGQELVAVLAGLVFEFAPFKIAAVGHLQNLSIFYLPLVMLLILKFFETSKRWFLAGLFTALVLLFYASWYQMVFALTVLGIFLIATLAFKLAKNKSVLIVAAVVFLALLMTSPLAKEYIRFSKQNNTVFSIGEQTHYSSSVADYFIPHSGTLLGKAYYSIVPDGQQNAYNLDSYSYHGISLYALMLIMLFLTYRCRKLNLVNKEHYRWMLVWTFIAIFGFILSLGPVLKVGGSYIYATLKGGMALCVPMPYILIDFLVPQLGFIRAVGRWSVLVLFALCVALAFLPALLQEYKVSRLRKNIIYSVTAALCFIELAPLHFTYMAQQPYAYNLQIPAVYEFVKDNFEIDDLIIIAGDNDYPDAKIPFARAEWVLWAGYHNKNIFNGYSGYTPPTYDGDYKNFQQLDSNIILELKKHGIRYVIIDKQLSSTRPELIINARNLLPKSIYEDDRYELFSMR